MHPEENDLLLENIRGERERERERIKGPNEDGFLIRNFQSHKMVEYLSSIERTISIEFYENILKTRTKYRKSQMKELLQSVR
jgi:hypothetical protein